MKNPNFLSGDLNTHFIDQHKKEIDIEMVNVIEEDAEYVNKLKSTFMPSKKIAAITAAVGMHQNAIKRKNDLKRQAKFNENNSGE